MCTDKNLNELLPVYVRQKLEPPERKRVESHLESCENCRAELSLLRMMAEETVPDPGTAFWAAMPGQIYREVQERKTKREAPALTRLLDLMAVPRWTWAAALVVTVLITSWFMLRPALKEPEATLSQEYESSDEIMDAGAVNLAELDHAELGIIETWAGAQLASIASEAAQVIGNGNDRDLSEELGELNAGETKQLLKLIEQRSKEG